MQMKIGGKLPESQKPKIHSSTLGLPGFIVVCCVFRYPYMHRAGPSDETSLGCKPYV